LNLRVILLVDYGSYPAKYLKSQMLEDLVFS